MPTLTGIGMTATVDDANGDAQNITADVLSINFNTPRGAQDVTSLDVSSMKRLLLLGDGTVDMTCVVNDSTNASFDTLVSSAGTYKDTRTVALARNGHTLSMEMVLTGLSHSRPQSGEWTFTANLQLANGSDPTWT